MIQEERLNAAKAVIDEVVDRGALKMAMGMIGNDAGVLMVHASGQTGPDSAKPVQSDSIFAIASMTKLVTTVAALQLVEKSKLDLDLPIDAYLPEIKQLSVLDGFDADGNPVFVDAIRAPSARELITHTSGYVYSIWNADALTLQAKGLTEGVGSGAKMLEAPLAFQPGSSWEYGIGIDWLGVVIEEISGMRLQPYFEQHIFQPLGMTDTTFEFEQAKLHRGITLMSRKDNQLIPALAMQPTPQARGESDFYNGGGGLYSTMSDYARLLTTLLNGGVHGDVRLLSDATVDSMFENQIGDLNVTPGKAQIAELSNDLDLSFSSPAKWGLGFLLHTQGTKNGRSPGSVSWAGLFNSFFWLDRKAGLYGVFATQVLPFMDEEAVATLTAFERAVYGLNE